ncbi:MAG: zinc ribbon domain-containing protein [Ignavibacteriales bacterium]|nr:MAG: zinc ribbon domain-containing protein [Ignavibacteriales bacterium]
MPNYDYKCTKCKKTFEIFQKMTDEPIEKCPECNGKLKRLIGAGAGPIFKGSGFYQTDYKNSSSKATDTKSSGHTTKPKSK